MRKPSIPNEMRDCTDNHLRRSAAALGYKGKHLPMNIADVLVHPNRPHDFTLLRHAGERRRDAATRLRNWAWPVPADHIPLSNGASAWKDPDKQR